MVRSDIFRNWFLIRRDLPQSRRLILTCVSFLLPVAVWCFVSYVPWIWHPDVKIELSAEREGVTTVFTAGDHVSRAFFPEFVEAVRKDNAVVLAARSAGTIAAQGTMPSPRSAQPSSSRFSPARAISLTCAVVIRSRYVAIHAKGSAPPRTSHATSISHSRSGPPSKNASIGIMPSAQGTNSKSWLCQPKPIPAAISGAPAACTRDTSCITWSYDTSEYANDTTLEILEFLDGMVDGLAAPFVEMKEAAAGILDAAGKAAHAALSNRFPTKG